MPGCHILTKSLSDGRAGDEELELAVRKTEWNNISSLETTSRREMLVLSAEFPKTEYCKGKKWHLPQDDYRRRLYNRVVWKERRVQNEGRLPASNVSHSHSFQKWFFNVVVVAEPCRSRFLNTNSLVQTTGRIRLCTTGDTVRSLQAHGFLSREKCRLVATVYLIILCERRTSRIKK